MCQISLPIPQSQPYNPESALETPHLAHLCMRRPQSKMRRSCASSLLWIVRTTRMSAYQCPYAGATALDVVSLPYLGNPRQDRMLIEGYSEPRQSHTQREEDTTESKDIHKPPIRLRSPPRHRRLSAHPLARHTHHACDSAPSTGLCAATPHQHREALA